MGWAKSAMVALAMLTGIPQCCTGVTSRTYVHLQKLLCVWNYTPVLKLPWMARRRHKNFQQISAFSLTLCSKRHTSNMAAWFHLYGVTAPHVHRTSDNYKRLAAHIFDWLYMVKNVQQSAGDRLEVDVPSIGRRLLHRTVRTFHPAQPHTHAHTNG